jgi:hypothetical protein
MHNQGYDCRVTMTPVERMTTRAGELTAEHRTLAERIKEIEAELERIQTALSVLREFDPFGEAPGDETPARFAGLDLKTPSLAMACASILREIGEPATARDLTNVLLRAGRWEAEKPSSLISVIQTLNKRTDLFEKVGKAWRLTNKLLPGEPARNGQSFEALPMEPE